MRRRDFLRRGARAAAGLTLATRATAARSTPRDQSAPGIPEIERLIQKLMADAGVPGASIAVVRDGRLAWRRAFGVRDAVSRVPVDDDTIFAVASVSKTVFAYAAMNLCDKGVLGLDTPLVHYARARFLDGDPRLDRITTRHALSHTSGLQNWRSGDAPLRIHFEPGDKHLYSGEGYFYLQSVITDLRGRRDPTTCERFEADVEVCGTDVDTYLRTNLLEPFGMRNSGYLWTDDGRRRAARAHAPDGTPLEAGGASTAALARYAAAGGLHTTATDYAKFLIEVIDPGPADAFRLSKSSRDEMIRPHVKVDGSSSWALGWQVRHTPTGDLIQHQGGQGGVQAFTAASPARRSGYVILTNSANGMQVFYAPAFVDAMDRYLFSRPEG
ncbi:MAG TPA: serine hydrolase domain-containing protein [Vicinamibacterales bacterium]|nr:serine hydrolase domain-containing protein [Vicinamibacterales bacterium]